MAAPRPRRRFRMIDVKLPHLNLRPRLAQALTFELVAANPDRHDEAIQQRVQQLGVVIDVFKGKPYITMHPHARFECH